MSDGSYHPYHPKHKIATSVVIGRGYGRTPPGDSKHKDSYRSELIGLYMGLKVVSIVAKDLRSELRPKVIITCNNLSGFEKGLRMESMPTIIYQHFDVLWELHYLRAECNVSIDARHVKGHQLEDAIKNDQLARMNHATDRLAKDMLTYCISTGYDKCTDMLDE